MNGTVCIRVAPDVLDEWEQHAAQIREFAEDMATRAGGVLLTDEPTFTVRDEATDVLFAMERPARGEVAP